MKQDVLTKLESFREQLRDMRKELLALEVDRVSRNSLRTAADAIASMWVEELRSPLEHRFRIDPEVISSTAEQMKRLHILSRPNNHKSSYLSVVNSVLKEFDNKFILPIKQASCTIDRVVDLTKIIASLPDPEESGYLKEAIECASAGHFRASIVMGWCYAIDRIQRTVEAVGYQKFSSTSTSLKNRTSGRFKRWNKEFQITTLGELQQVFDTDMITVVEGMGIIDSNQAERLMTCFQYRCHSAHPGEAPISEVHLIAFFADLNQIIFENPRFVK